MKSTTSDDRFEVSAQDDDVSIAYMNRTRDWYLALGYDNPYRWAHLRDVPFAPLKKSLSDARVTVITTAAPYRPELGPQGPGAPYNAGAKFYEVYEGDTTAEHDLRIAHVAIDRVHTSMEDSASWFPLAALRRARSKGRIGSIAPFFFGVPTQRSQRQTLDVDAPEVLRRCRRDGVDAAVLLPNCPVCHQSLSLVARELEAAGIPTVVMGCARDVVEHCGVPRFLFSDFPLGNPAGRPHDPASQDETLAWGLGLLESAIGPRTTLQSPLRWAEDAAWKADYMNPSRLSPAELARLRAEAEAARLEARALRAATLGRAAAP